jgi:nucleoid DNA-binding protein
LTFRKARQVVDAIISIWESNLIDHLPVETPLGWIGTPCGPQIRSRVCFEKVCVLFSVGRRVRLTKKKKGLFTPPPDNPIDKHNQQGSPSATTPDLQCPECGGSYFTEVICQQYQQGMYSSSIGGQLRPLTDEDPIRTLVCLCGCALTLQSLAISNPLRDSFHASFEKARAYRCVEALEQRLQSATAELVDVAELAPYDEQVRRIETLADLCRYWSKAPQPPKPAPPKPEHPDEHGQPTFEDGSFSKARLVLKLSSTLDIYQEQAERIVECVFDAIKSAVACGNRIGIRGFGIFSARGRKAWKGRNPKTRERFGVGPTRTGHFKASKRLKTLVNQVPGDLE